MKIACFSDLHAHTFREFDCKSDRTGSQRLDNIVDTLVYIRKYCRENDIKYVSFSGDLFHIRGRVNTVVFNSIYDEIKRFGEDNLQLVMIAGNHDQVDNSDVPQHSLYPFDDLPHVHVYGDLAVHTIHDEFTGETVDIYCVPYSKNAQRTKDWLTNQEPIEGYRRDRVCLFHLGISGGLVGSGSYPMSDAFNVEDLRPNFFKYILGGHFHKRQYLGGYNHVLYTGAPIQHSFGDEGEDKGFYIVDTSKRCDIQFVPIPNPKFFTLDMYKIANEDMQLIADEGHYVRLKLKEDEVQVALSYLPPNLQYKIVLEREYKEETRVDVQIGMSFEQIVETYADEFNPDAKEIGLRILREVQGGL
jgi:DNA repair exonuclease SbcCD nuclease subunit